MRTTLNSASGMWILGLTAALLAAPAGAQAACSIVSGDFDGNGTTDVRFLGDARRQNLSVVHRASGIEAEMDCNGDRDVTDPEDLAVNLPAPVETLDIQLKGSDEIEYFLAGAASAQRFAVAVVLGPGVNFLFINDAVGSSLTNRSSAVFDITGGGGTDSVYVRRKYLALTDSTVLVRADLGGGNDFFRYREVPGLTSGTVELDVALGTGNNIADVRSEGLSVGSRLRVDVEGGDTAGGADSVRGHFASTVEQSSLSFTSHLRSGNDSADATLEPGWGVYSGGVARLRLHGGAGTDSLVVGDGGGTENVPNDGLLDVGMTGDSGADVLLFDLRSVDGPGTLRLHAEGGEHADTVLASVVNDPFAFVGGGNRFDVLLGGGRHEDTLYAAAFDPNGTASYAALDGFVLTGGPVPYIVGRGFEILDPMDHNVGTFFGDGTVPHRRLLFTRGSN